MNETEYVDRTSSPGLILILVACGLVGLAGAVALVVFLPVVAVCVGLPLILWSVWVSS